MLCAQAVLIKSPQDLGETPCIFHLRLAHTANTHGGPNLGLQAHHVMSTGRGGHQVALETHNLVAQHLHFRRVLRVEGAELLRAARLRLCGQCQMLPPTDLPRPVSIPKQLGLGLNQTKSATLLSFSFSKPL